MQTDPGSGADRLLRRLPSLDRLLAAPEIRAVAEGLGAERTAELARERLESVRREVRAGRIAELAALERAVAPAAIAAAVRHDAEALLRPTPRIVVNATGIVVHTNLGRAVLSDAAAARVAEVASRYHDLEYDLGTGRRGRRSSHLEPLMARLFPDAGFLVVNNNAAAILLALRALARRREVVVSRGELVEIGGSFRVPDILAASGARLREVGTTNRTRLSDYAAAVGPRTGAILKVHTSNFRIVGFAEDAPIAELAGLARQAGVPLIVDWGSGALVDLAPLGLRDEAPVARILEAGADLVTFSGDKLLGGPQAGFVLGREPLVRKLGRDPLARVCRLDRIAIAALAETLRAYVLGREREEIPTLRMLALDPEAIRSRAAAVLDAVRAGGGSTEGMRLVDGVSKSGGGSSPLGERPTVLIEIAVEGGDAGRLERRLRRGDPPVLGRLHDGRLLLDLRTVLPDQDAVLAARLAE